MSYWNHAGNFTHRSNQGQGMLGHDAEEGPTVGKDGSLDI